MSNRADDYNRTGSPVLDGATPSDAGAPWTEETHGAWKTDTDAVSGRVVAYNIGGPMAAWLESSVSDHSASIRLVTVLTNIGVICRVVDKDNYYLFHCSGGTMTLYEKVAGTFTALSTGGAMVVSGDIIELRCVGTTISGFVNGTLTDTVFGSALPGGTKAGIYGGSGYADDFAITDLSGGGGGSVSPWWIFAAQQAA